MSANGNGGSAFPEVDTDMHRDIPERDPYPRTYSYGGMTLRDYFAGQALPSLIVDSSWNVESANGAKVILPKHIAKEAYAIADAMLAERKK